MLFVLLVVVRPHDPAHTFLTRVDTPLNPRCFPPLSSLHTSEGIMLVNMSLPAWPILFVNEAWEKATGVARDALTGDAFWSSFAVRCYGC